MKRLLFMLLLAIALAGPAAATTFGFDCISGGASACGVGEAQLFLDVTDGGNGTVALTLRNTGAVGSSVANVYVDLAFEFAGVSLSFGPGVSFAAGGSPPILPGGQNVSFQSDLRFSADNPKPVNGVNPGESLTLVLTLGGGKTFSDVLSALADGTLRVGVHLISIANPACGPSDDFTSERSVARAGDFGDDGGGCDDLGSASFVNDPHAAPEPSLALLGAAALAAFAARRKLARS